MTLTFLILLLGCTIMLCSTPISQARQFDDGLAAYRSMGSATAAHLKAASLELSNYRFSEPS
jgi:hypothetical protein